MSETQVTDTPVQSPPTPSAAPCCGARRILRGIGVLILGLVLAGMIGWVGLAVYYSNLHGGPPRTIWAMIVVLLSIATLILVRPRKLGLAAFAVLFTCVLFWFYSLTPSADLTWTNDVALMPSATVEGDLVHFRNVRNFEYRSETDFTPGYYDKTFDLSRLRRVDYILSYWASRAIAHAFVSFEFDDGQHLAVSIETRKEQGESYSAVEGFFRQYELIYVVADERDLIGLRTNHRAEDVYLFRLRTPIEKVRAVFLDYIRMINSLAEEPQFYNALTQNCTTSILSHFSCYPPYPPMSVEVLLSGYSAHYSYSYGGVDTSMPFEELEKRSRITEVAKTAPLDSSFSARIRQGLPNPPLNIDIKNQNPTSQATP
jgi:hypothetical protein